MVVFLLLFLVVYQLFYCSYICFLLCLSISWFPLPPCQDWSSVLEGVQIAWLASNKSTLKPATNVHFFKLHSIWLSHKSCDIICKDRTRRQCSSHHHGHMRPSLSLFDITIMTEGSPSDIFYCTSCKPPSSPNSFQGKMSETSVIAADSQDKAKSNW